MAQTPTIMISFQHVDEQDGEVKETVRESLERRLRAIAEEFPETTRYEVTLGPDGVGHVAHGRVTGKGTEVATHAGGAELLQAADALADKLERQLRRAHDKRIFVQRREAQKSPPKRG